MGEPTHLTVDGTPQTPYILVAVIFLTTTLTIITYHAVRFTFFRKYARALVLLVVLLSICVRSDYGSQLIAFWLTAAILRRITPTTFFGTPPTWIMPTTAVISSVLSAVWLRRKEHP
jgi:hypothetical protein